MLCEGNAKNGCALIGNGEALHGKAMERQREEWHWNRGAVISYGEAWSGRTKIGNGRVRRGMAEAEQGDEMRRKGVA